MKVLSLLALIGLSQSALAERRPSLASQARQYVDAHKAEGMSIAVVRCGAESFVSAGTGVEKRATSRDDVFEIGSLSKLYTGLLLAKAVAAGRASLQDDVRRFLPPGYDNLQWNDGTPIRLLDLVATTSGLPDYLPDPAPLSKLPQDEVLAAASRLLAGYTEDAFLHDLSKVRLSSRPGSATHHSNVAAQLLGLVLSRIYEKPFREILQQEVERPAGMRAGADPAPLSSSATGHDGGGRPAPIFTGPSVMPAGGLRYSARDMAGFIRLQLSRDPAVLLSHRKLATSEDGNVAFTWLISSPRRSVTRYRLTGSTFGFSSYVEVYPALGYGIAILANRGAGDVQNDLMAIAERVFDHRRTATCTNKK